MFRSLLAVLGCIVFAQLAIADDRAAITGTWKVMTFEIEFQDTGERRPVFGKAPKGYIIFTPEGRTMSYLDKLEGGLLRIVTQWNPAPLYDNRVARGVLVLERER